MVKRLNKNTMADTNDQTNVNVDPNAGNTDAGSEGDNAAGDASSSSAEGNNGSDGDSDDGQPDPPKTPKDPVVRNNNAFHAGKRIAQRQASQSKPNDGDGGEGEGNGEGNGSDNNQEPETDPRLDAVLENQQRQDDQRAVDAVVNQYPELAEYTDQVLNYAKHPSRANVPIDTIFLEVVGIEKLFQLGFQKGSEAKSKQDGSAPSGTDNRTAAADKPIDQMTDAEFKAYQDRVRNGE